MTQKKSDQDPYNPWPKLPVDDPFLVSYDFCNTGKEVIQNFYEFLSQ